MNRSKFILKIFVIGLIVSFIIPNILGYSSQFSDSEIYNLGNTHFVPGEIIVKFNSEIILDDFRTLKSCQNTGFNLIDSLNEKYQVYKIEKLFNSNKNTVLKQNFLCNIYKFSLPKESDILPIVEEYSLCPYVLYAEPNYIYKICRYPDDSDFNLQWALHNTGQTNGTIDADIDAPEAWDIEIGNKNIVIAVHDTGVDWDHPDLASNIWINQDEILDGTDTDNNGYIDDIRGWDFVDTSLPVYPSEDGVEPDNDPMDCHGHGTHCSGIVGSVANNNIGTVGVCWNCSIMAVRVGFKSKSGRSGFLEDDDCALGIEYAVDNGADIISMSWGGTERANLILDAMNYADSQGVVLVAAAGNDNDDWNFYPAAYDNVISVAATDHNDSRAYFSNYGSWVDVAAPGVDIYNTLFNDTYISWSGTSMATPHVAGLVGLMKSKNPNLNSEEILTILHSTADDVNSDEYIGLGRINAYRAIQIDSTSIANLNSSLDDVGLLDSIFIYGSAYGSKFNSYKVSYGIGIYPDEWIDIHSSQKPIENGLLAHWDTSSLINNETYTVCLVVYDSISQLSLDQAVVIKNSAPSTPELSGPTRCIIEEKYSFNISSVDFNGDEINFYVEWDDSSIEEWIGPYDSGEIVKVKHNWTEKGIYNIRVKARDVYGAESDWATLEINVPKNKAMSLNLFLQRFFHRFPFFDKILNQIII
jgi:subtilisin family serine protease